MLKIKDNIDLKELEKFGFEYNLYEDFYEKEFFYKDDIYKDDVYHSNLIVIKKGHIDTYECFDDDYRYASHLTNYIEDNIQNLIQAGLVEKVVE